VSLSYYASMKLSLPQEAVKPPVCIIDGDPAVRAGLTYLCDSSGYVVIPFSTGSAFLRALDQTSHLDFHSVICEAQLPDRGGVDLYLTMQRRGLDLPFALMVSGKNRACAHFASQVGIKNIWCKPLLDSVLLSEFLSGYEV